MQAMSQKPRLTHSAPLTADALATLFEALMGCETTLEATYAAREILAGLGDMDGADEDGRNQ